MCHKFDRCFCHFNFSGKELNYRGYFDDDNSNSLYWFVEVEKNKSCYILYWTEFFVFFFRFGCALLFAASAFCKHADNMETIGVKRFHSIILWFGSAQTRENHLYLNASLDLSFFYYWNSGFDRGGDYNDFAKGV